VPYWKSWGIIRFAKSGRNPEKRRKILRSQDKSWDMVTLVKRDLLDYSVWYLPFIYIVSHLTIEIIVRHNLFLWSLSLFSNCLRCYFCMAFFNFELVHFFIILCFIFFYYCRFKYWLSVDCYYNYFFELIYQHVRGVT
jgi:hypothetical protein